MSKHNDECGVIPIPVRLQQGAEAEAESSLEVFKRLPEAVWIRVAVEYEYTTCELVGEQPVSKLGLRRGLPFIKMQIPIKSDDTHSDKLDRASAHFVKMAIRYGVIHNS